MPRTSGYAGVLFCVVSLSTLTTLTTLTDVEYIYNFPGQGSGIHPDQTLTRNESNPSLSSSHPAACRGSVAQKAG